MEFLQTLRGGTAHVILFSDNRKYVVKWHRTHKKRAKEVINEYVVSTLAMLLSLPVVPFDIVYISEEFLQKTPQLHSEKYTFRAGYHFACLYIEKSITLHEVEQLPSQEKVENCKMLAAMAVFDHWVNNIDRTKSNILLQPIRKDMFYFHMIDHGKCFPGGYKWTPKTLREKQNYHIKYQATYQWVNSIVNKAHYSAFLTTIASFPNVLIREVIDSIPEEWNVTKDERESLYQFLVKRKSQLSIIIINFIDYYGDFVQEGKKARSTNKSKGDKGYE